MDNWQSIKEFYSKNGVFLCANSDSEEGSFEAEVHNILYPPVSEKVINHFEDKFSKTLTPSHRKFLYFSNGGIFFSQKVRDFGKLSFLTKLKLDLFYPLHKKRFEYESGFQLYSISDMPIKHKEVVSSLRDIIDIEDYIFDESEKEEKENCNQWLDNILVIGEELNSDNYIAIDYNRRASGSEYPIIFIDHEVPLAYSEIEDDEPIISTTVDELLMKALDDPANFLMEVLGETATYSDGKTDFQWYPVSYKSIVKV